MPLFRKIEQGPLLLGVWKMEEETAALLSYFDNPTPYLDGIQSFSGEKRVKEWLSVRVLLRELCGDEKRIAYHPSGKPYLADNSYHVSISHTRDYVTVILHPTRETGVDIEKYGKKVHRVKHKFLTDREITHIPSACETEYLLVCWSAKETIYKLLGREDAELKKHLCVLPFSFAGQGIVRVQELITDRKQYFDVHYFTHPDFVLTYSF